MHTHSLSLIHPPHTVSQNSTLKWPSTATTLYTTAKYWAPDQHLSSSLGYYIYIDIYTVSHCTRTAQWSHTSNTHHQWPRGKKRHPLPTHPLISLALSLSFLPLLKRKFTCVHAQSCGEATLWTWRSPNPRIAQGRVPNPGHTDRQDIAPTPPSLSSRDPFIPPPPNPFPDPPPPLKINPI